MKFTEADKQFLEEQHFEMNVPDAEDLNNNIPISYSLPIEKHPFLGDGFMMVTDYIDVYCTEPENGTTSGNQVLIIRRPFTHDQLKQVLKFIFPDN